MPVELCWNNVAHNIEKPVATESLEERIARSDKFILTYTDELCSPNFKLCVQEAIPALSTNVDKSIDIIVRALYGAAACMIKTAGYKKKRLNDWFKPRVCANEKVSKETAPQIQEIQ